MNSHDFIDLYTRDLEKLGLEATRDELGLV